MVQQRLVLDQDVLHGSTTVPGDVLLGGHRSAGLQLPGQPQGSFRRKSPDRLPHRDAMPTVGRRLAHDCPFPTGVGQHPESFPPRSKRSSRQIWTWPAGRATYATSSPLCMPADRRHGIEAAADTRGVEGRRTVTASASFSFSPSRSATADCLTCKEPFGSLLGGFFFPRNGPLCRPCVRRRRTRLRCPEFSTSTSDFLNGFGAAHVEIVGNNATNRVSAS